MSAMTAGERITNEVTSWPGVEAGEGRRGEYSFKVGGREIGHLHGDHAAHFGFPRKVWAELIEQGRIVRHSIDHDGWGARRLEDEGDVAEAIALMRLNYDRAVSRHGLPSAA
jgi:hypothetical protein